MHHAARNRLESQGPGRRNAAQCNGCYIDLACAFGQSSTPFRQDFQRERRNETNRLAGRMRGRIRSWTVSFVCFDATKIRAGNMRRNRAAAQFSRTRGKCPALRPAALKCTGETRSPKCLKIKALPKNEPAKFEKLHRFSVPYKGRKMPDFFSGTRGKCLDLVKIKYVIRKNSPNASPFSDTTPQKNA